LEFKGSLYVNEDKIPILPSEGIEAIVTDGAKKSKEGNLSKAGVICTESPVLEYDGPKNPDGLWKDTNFVFTVGAKVNRNRINRTRPIFRKWACNIKLNYNDTMCNKEQVIGWLKTAGEQCGAFDWRPKFGRFQAEEIK